MSDGHVEGNNLFCAVHNWDYRIDTGVSEYNNAEALHKFDATIVDDEVRIAKKDVDAFLEKHPQPFNRDEYLGLYQDIHGGPEEPSNGYIQMLSLIHI